MITRKFSAILFSTLLLGCASVRAQVVITNNQATFLAGLNAPSYTEDFTAYQSNASNGGTKNLSGNGFAYTLTTTRQVYFGSGLAGAVDPTATFTFTFTSGNVSAIGGNFFLSGFSDEFVSGPVSITLSDGTSQIFNPTGKDFYIGFTNTTGAVFTSLIINASQANSFNSVDNITVGTATSNLTAVPEPSTYGLMGAAALLAVAVRRRYVARRA